MKITYVIVAAFAAVAAVAGCLKKLISATPVRRLDGDTKKRLTLLLGRVRLAVVELRQPWKNQCQLPGVPSWSPVDHPRLKSRVHMQ